ncbi:GL15664, partial [Drosophila persimilis]
EHVCHAVQCESNEDSVSSCDKAHSLREALASYEEAQRLQRMCRFLKNKTSLTQAIKEANYQAQEEYENFRIRASANKVDESYDLVERVVEASSKFTLTLTGPDFTSYKVEDPFKRLGPIAIFSARRHWTAPRCVRLQKGSAICHDFSAFPCDTVTTRVAHEKDCRQYKEEIENFGFQVSGDSPVIIAHVEINSLADLGGIKEGDFVVEIEGMDVKWFSHQQVVHLIQSCGSVLELKVITPMDRNYLKVCSKTLHIFIPI